MTWLTNISVLVMLLVGNWQSAEGQGGLPRRTKPSHDAIKDRAEQAVQQLRQGMVKISTTDSGRYEIRRNDTTVGHTPSRFTQRLGAERVYSIRDTRGRVLCKQSVRIDFPYQTTELLCDPRTRKFSEQDSNSSLLDDAPPTMADTAAP